MSRLKIRREKFFPFHYASVEKKLEDMAANGWQLLTVENNLWVYQKTEPKKLRYSTAYIPTASEYDSDTDLDDYCLQAGWTKVTNWEKMQIYCTEDPDAVEIETDETLRFRMICRSMNKSFLWVQMVMLIRLLLEVFDMIGDFNYYSNLYLTHNSSLERLPYILAVAVYSIINLSAYGLWLYRSKKSIEAGGGCVEINMMHPFSFLCWVLSINALISDLTIGIVLIGSIAAGELFFYLRIYLRCRGVKNETNDWISIAYISVMVVCIGACILGIS